MKKLSLRNKFFRSLVGFLFFVYVLLLIVLGSMEMREAIRERSSFSDEIPEIVAFGVVILITLPTGLFFAWYVSGRLLQPLRFVLETAERVRHGNLDERIPSLSSKDELSELGNTINEAFDQYAVTVRRLESFSANASHQLRTPITGIRLSAEVALQRDRTTGEYKEALGDIIDQAGRLGETVDQLLLLAQMDASLTKDFQPLVLSGLLRDWIAEMSKASDGVAIEYRETGDAAGKIVHGNATLLRQCFDNLINNAMAILKNNGKIEVHLRTRGAHEIEWSVEDSGPGIALSDRALVFDRFYQNKQRSTGGSGLGLAIVREIIRIHSGTVQAEQSASLGGAALVIRIPCGS